MVTVAKLDPPLCEELWRQCDGSTYGLDRDAFEQILIGFAHSQNYGKSEDATPSSEERASYLRSLKISDLVLARACANGDERAWEHFFTLYKQPLVRAAIAITGSTTLGHDLADALYAELYGLTTRQGERRCPLHSFKGRGTLVGWLRTTLAQRHVDHHRRVHREVALDLDIGANELPAPPPSIEESPVILPLLAKAIEEAIDQREPEDCFLLAAYYLDGQTLQQVGRVLRVHEATISRKLRLVTYDIRKQVLSKLQRSGLSKRAAQEALGSDPRDLNLNLKVILQSSQSDAFSEKADL